MPDHQLTSEAENVVRAFFAAWETEGFVPAFERYMHPEAVWQNVGFPDAAGRDAYMTLLRQYNSFSGMPFGRVYLKNIVAKGNVVLTERIDNLFDNSSEAPHATPIMGTFEIEDGLIKRYADYFDPRPFFDMIERRGRSS